MTTLQEGLVSYIEAQVTAAGKGYPLQAPQDASYPTWIYQLIDDDQLLSHSGGTGLCKARVQIDVMAKETASLSAYGNAAGVAKQIRSKLDGFRGDMGGVQVEFCKTAQSDGWAEIHKLPTTRFDVIVQYILE